MSEPAHTARTLALLNALDDDSFVIMLEDTRRKVSELKEMMVERAENSTFEVNRETNTSIEFERGSRIVFVQVGDGMANLRGYAPDTIVSRTHVSETDFEEVIEPMVRSHGTHYMEVI